MLFRFSPGHSRPNSALIYRAAEYSFDVEPTPAEGFASVTVNDLNLELNSEGMVISLWGICPFTTWRRARLHPPEAEYAEVFVLPESDLKSGVSLALFKDSRFPVYFDPESGIINLAIDGGRALAVMVLPGIVLEFGSLGKLTGIWLKPLSPPHVSG